MTRYTSQLGAALLAAGAATACSAPHPETPDILVLVLDTTREDVLGWRRPGDSLTPALDALASRGTLFTNTLSVSSWTTPNHASLLTGLAPRAHGSTRAWLSEALTGAEASAQHPMNRQRYAEIERLHQSLARLDEGGLAEALSSRGYRTGMFPTNPNLFYLNDAFDVRPEHSSPGAPHRVDDAETIRSFEDFLDETEGPLFALVNLLGAHAPYELADTPRCRRAEALLEALGEGPEPDIVRPSARATIARWRAETSPTISEARLTALLAELGYLDVAADRFTPRFFDVRRQSDLGASVTRPGDRALLANLASYIAPLRGADRELMAMAGVFVSPSTPADGGPVHQLGEAAREALHEAYRCGIPALDADASRVIEDFLEARPGGYIAVLADHGEGFGDGSEARSYYNHAMLLPSIVRIPMFVYGPGIGAGTIDAPAQITDLFPTLLEWAGAERSAPEPTRACGAASVGRSLAPLLARSGGWTSRLRLLETYPGTAHSFRYLDPEYDCVWLGAERDGLLLTWPDSDRADGACRQLSPMAFALEPVRDRYEDIYDPDDPAQQELLRDGQRCLPLGEIPVYESLEALRAAARGAPPLDPGAEEALEALGYL